MSQDGPAAPLPTARLVRTAHGNMLLPLNDIVVSRCLLLYGEWAFAETALLGRLLRPGDVAVDCGGHVGSHTLFFARCVGPAGRVLSFEPQRLLYQYLCANVALNGFDNVMAFWAALGEKPGLVAPPEIDPQRPENLGGRRLDPNSPPRETDGRSMQVPVMTLDGFSLSSCRLIKIDAEGMEGAIVAGAARTIRRHRPLLYVENNDLERSPALISAIADLGYRLYWHFSPYFRPGNPNRHAENVFPNTADPNMLCLPAEAEAAIEAMDPVTGPEDDWRQARERLIRRMQASRTGAMEGQ